MAENERPMSSVIQRATELTPDVRAAIDDLFTYHAPTPEQVEAMQAVRAVLADAVAVIVESCPPTPNRSVAIRKLVEARMDANAAIIFRGEY